MFEIGGAGGANLIPFKKLKKKVSGNELSKKLIEFAKKGIEVKYAEISSVPPKVDLIILQHVLEHLFDPEILLKEIYRKKDKVFICWSSRICQ